VTQRIVIVGASLGGLRAAEALRSQHFDGEIVVIGDEVHAPYNRPPLSKEVLADQVSHEAVAFRQRASVSDVIWHLGDAAQSLSGTTVTTQSGTRFDADGVVIATGIRPRTNPLAGAASHRMTLRTLDDAIALRERLQPGAKVLVVGAGFIGCEVAATATTLGCQVSVVAVDEEPMIRPLGSSFGAALRQRHEARGVTFHLGTGIQAIDDTPEGAVVTLGDGTQLEASVIVEAIGSIPNVEWLEGQGFDLTDGVLCDNDMRVIGGDHVVAVGDVARFPNPLFDDVPRRIEHWNIPTDTARRAVMTLLGDLGLGEGSKESFTPMPAFWSDQFDLRLQAFGLPGLAGNEPGDVTIECGDLSGDVIVAYRNQGRLVGIVGVGFTKELQALRAEIGMAR